MKSLDGKGPRLVPTKQVTEPGEVTNLCASKVWSRKWNSLLEEYRNMNFPDTKAFLIQKQP